ncbi:FN3 associated domain-containing protein [Eubacteriaceae bacterium ES3]|nr:FN3 associated domain-containing protein [Eubacteriaceae bacterium ES3]
MIVNRNSQLLQPEITTVTNEDGSSEVTIVNPNQEGTIYYTLDGVEPLTNSKVYEGPFMIKQTTTLKTRVILENKMSAITTQQFTITQNTSSLENSTNMNAMQNETSSESDQTVMIENLGVDVNTLFDVTATSSLSPMSGYYYTPWNLLDYDWSTAWVEGVSGNGIGESVSFTYMGTEMSQIVGVEIVNGYAKSDKSFYENGCVTQLGMYVNGTYVQTLYLSSTPTAQYYDFYFVVASGDVITFMIESVSEGPNDGEYDTAISEITFF